MLYFDRQLFIQSFFVLVWLSLYIRVISGNLPLQCLGILRVCIGGWRHRDMLVDPGKSRQKMRVCTREKSKKEKNKFKGKA